MAFTENSVQLGVRAGVRECPRSRGGVSLHSPTVEHPARRFLTTADAVGVELAPLFEEIRHVGFETLDTDAARPLGVHRSGSGATLPTDDHPVNALEVEVEGREQRFAAQEAHRGGDGAENVDPRGPALVLRR